MQRSKVHCENSNEKGSATSWHTNSRREHRPLFHVSTNLRGASIQRIGYRHRAFLGLHLQNTIAVKLPVEDGSGWTPTDIGKTKLRWSDVNPKRHGDRRRKESREKKHTCTPRERGEWKLDAPTPTS